MTARELFDLWAPETSPWSDWAKPSLFEGAVRIPIEEANAGPANVEHGVLATLESGAPTAIVVDFPGAHAVKIGLALAQRGWRPVPMFNTTDGEREIVETRPLLGALSGAVPILRALDLPESAPPAFLLDANRLAKGSSGAPGTYDNRWIVFPQDFPSAAFLRSRNLERVVLLAPSNASPHRDLDDVLARWRRGGIEVLRANPDGEDAPEPYRPMRWWPVRLAFLVALVSLGLRRNSAGGFGSRVPEASSGGGYWG